VSLHAQEGFDFGVDVRSTTCGARTTALAHASVLVRWRGLRHAAAIGREKIFRTRRGFRRLP